MVIKIYLDTSIWLDHYLKRGKNGDAALRLILKIIKDDLIIIFSNYNEKELKDLNFSPFEISELLSMIRWNLRKVQVNKEQFDEARRVSKQRSIPLGDAIHAVIARDNEAVLISRDHDFERLVDIVETKPPEELL